MKAIAIIRTSTVKQEIESQKQEVISWAKKDGWNEEDIIVIGDAGASAIKLDDLYLKNMNLVEKHILSGSIKCVYAWALDRIGRNEETLMRFKNMLIDNKVQLKTKEPELTLLNADGTANKGVELAFSLFSTMAKQEMEQKKARFKRAKIRNGESGKWNGGAETRFGYTLDRENRIVADTAESLQVKNIFKLYATGKYSMQKLADELNSRGETHRGKKYTLDFIARVLADTTYIGYKEQKDPEKKRYTTKYEQIIENELWEKVKTLRENQVIFATATKETKNIHYATKILKCRTCGSNFFADFDKYNCYTRKLGNGKRFNDKCESETLTIKVDVMDFVLWNLTKYLETHYLRTLDTSKLGEYEEELAIIDCKVDTISKKMGKLTTAYKNLNDDYTFGEINKDEYKRRIGKNRAEYIKCQAEQSKLQEERERIEDIIYDIKHPRNDSFDTILSELEGSDQINAEEANRAERKQIINKHLKEAYIDRIIFKGKKATLITITDKYDNTHYFIYDYSVRKKDEKEYLYFWSNSRKDLIGFKTEYDVTERMAEIMEKTDSDVLKLIEEKSK